MHNPNEDKIISIRTATEKGRGSGMTRRELPDRLKEEFDGLMEEIVNFRDKIFPSQIQNKS